MKPLRIYWKVSARVIVLQEIDESLSANPDESVPFCVNYWNEKKRILSEKFSIQWKSPIEMNPNIRF